MTAEEMGKIVGLHRKTITRQMSHLGVPRRGALVQPNTYLFHMRVSRKGIFDLYWREDKSMNEIADIYGVSQATVDRKMGSFEPPIKKKPGGLYSNSYIKAREQKTGYDNPLTKKLPSVYYRKSGYVTWHIGMGAEERRDVREHRITAIGEWGLDAVKGKHVHHANGIKWLNVPEFDMNIPELENPNLVPMDPISHSRAD